MHLPRLLLLVATAVLLRGETSLTLDVGFGTRYVSPARVTVPAGERVTVHTTGLTAPLIWRKDGATLAGQTATVLEIASATGADAGTYTAASAAAPTNPSQTLVLGVGPDERFLNVSARSWVGAGGAPFILGFSVHATGHAAKKVLVRVIGPSLAKFGVPHPLAHPTLNVFDADGHPYELGYGYTAVVGGLTPETDLANALATTGAFPTEKGTSDVVQLRPFENGTYTLHVGSADAGSGNVLVEVYEVP